jgi:hypothetical protein
MTAGALLATLADVSIYFAVFTIAAVGGFRILRITFPSLKHFTLSLLSLAMPLCW